MPAGQIQALADACDAYRDAHQAAIEAHNLAKAATQTKKARLAEGREATRRAARFLKANPSMSDAFRLKAGLRTPDHTRTRLDPSVVEKTPPPLILADWSERGRIILHVGPNPGNERNNGKPKGMGGVRIWYAVGGAPVDEDGWRYLTDVTSSPYVHVITVNAPTTIVYRAQYIDRLMRAGPFGDVVEAVAA